MPTSCFNPRPPRRGATPSGVTSCCVARFQSTPPTQGSDTIAGPNVDVVTVFQSTPPTQGSDANIVLPAPSSYGFNPRPPRRGATPAFPPSRSDRRVSIHAPHAGERRLATGMMSVDNVFQSTPPTQGSDSRRVTKSAASRRFNPRPPRRGATSEVARWADWPVFQSTPPTQGSDDGWEEPEDGDIVSIHAPHAGERQQAT